MKVYFASLTDMTLEVDAWVPTVEQGYVLLAALIDKYHNHNFVARARLQRYHNYEERFIGTSGADADDFLGQVQQMGRSEPTKGDGK